MAQIDEAECIENSLDEVVGEGEGSGRRKIVVAVDVELLVRVDG